MKIGLLIISITLYNAVQAQDTTFYNVVQHAINSIRNTPTIYYADSSIQFWGNLSRQARKKVLHGYENPKTNKKVRIKLSGKEWKELDKQANNKTPILLPIDLFSSGTRVNTIVVDSIAVVNTKRFNTNMQSPTHYYYFSKPIYTRKNSLLVFRLLDMIGHSAGYAKLFVYQLKDGVWQQKMVIHEGAF